MQIRIKFEIRTELMSISNFVHGCSQRPNYDSCIDYDADPFGVVDEKESEEIEEDGVAFAL